MGDPALFLGRRRTKSHVRKSSHRQHLRFEVARGHVSSSGAGVSRSVPHKIIQWKLILNRFSCTGTEEEEKEDKVGNGCNRI